MKQQLWRRDPVSYDAHYSLQSRYADLDTLQHLNNVAVQGLHAEGRQVFLLERLGRRMLFAQRWPLRVRLVQTEFLVVGNYPQALDCAVKLCGRTAHGLLLATALFQGGQCIGVQECELVGWSEDLPLTPHALLEVFGLAAAEALELEPIHRAQPLVPKNAFCCELPLRFADLDADACLSEITLARCVEQGRSAMLLDVIERAGLTLNCDLLVASVAIERLCLPPVSSGQLLRLHAAVGRQGRSSLAITVAIQVGEATVGLSHSLMVCVDPRTERSTPLPEGLRKALTGR